LQISMEHRVSTILQAGTKRMVTYVYVTTRRISVIRSVLKSRK
jgi:hypothetical protein